MFNNRVEITLNSVLGPKILTHDPIGYDQSEMEIGRSETTHGIFLKQINNLQFYGESKQYLEALWDLYGPQARCQLERREKHPKTDDWQLKSKGYLDFTTKDIKDGKFTINYVEGGLREVFTSQMKEKFELGRKKDINGGSISSLRTWQMVHKGREMYLPSKFSNDSKRIDFYSGAWQGGYRTAYYPIPLTQESNSDPDNLKEPAPLIQGEHGGHREGEGNSGNPVNKLLNLADRDHGKTTMSLDLSFELIDVDAEHRPKDRSFDVVMRRYSDQSATGGYQYTFEDEVLLKQMGDPLSASIPPDVNPNLKGKIQSIQDYEITFDPSELTGFNRGIKKGDSLAIFFKLRGDFATTGIDNESMTLTIDCKETLLKWNEDSFYKTTTTKCMTAYEVGQRLSEIFTGRQCFESYLLDGRKDTLLKTGANLVFAPGGWLRNLKREVESEDRDGNTIKILENWPIEFSFEDLYKSIHALLPVGYGIATSGNTQKIVLEDMSFFFRDEVLVDLGKIDIKSRSTAVEYCFQSLKFGYDKGGNYEKPLGLDEYNIKTTSRSPLTVTDKEYSALGPSRTDSYGAEDCRRMPYEEYSDRDTPYDKDNFMFHVKGESVFEVRTWQDDFVAPPKGVYSPDTAFNLELSPGRNRERHGRWFTPGFYKLKDENVQFLTSEGNSQLSTQKAGEDPLKENEQEIPVPAFGKPIFEPEWIEAESAFRQEVLDQITGTTIINGREVNNYYGKAKFINEKNKEEFAYIYTVKAKGKITYKLLKAYGS